MNQLVLFYGQMNNIEAVVKLEDICVTNLVPGYSKWGSSTCLVCPSILLLPMPSCANTMAGMFSPPITSYFWLCHPIPCKRAVLIPCWVYSLHVPPHTCVCVTQIHTNKPSTFTPDAVCKPSNNLTPYRNPNILILLAVEDLYVSIFGTVALLHFALRACLAFLLISVACRGVLNSIELTKTALMLLPPLLGSENDKSDKKGRSAVFLFPGLLLCQRKQFRQESPPMLTTLSYRRALICYSNYDNEPVTLLVKVILKTLRC